MPLDPADADYTSSVWTPFSFLGLAGEAAALDHARVVMLPVPYDSTTTFKAGARHGPRAIIEASYHLEDYDHEEHAARDEDGRDDGRQRGRAIANSTKQRCKMLTEWCTIHDH